MALQGGEVALPLCAEAEVTPYDEPCRAQAAHQNFLDEARRAECGKVRSEANYVHAIDAGGGHQLELVAQAA